MPVNARNTRCELDLPAEACDNYQVQQDKGGGVHSWQKSDCRKASPSRMHCADLNARYSRKTLSRK